MNRVTYQKWQGALIRWRIGYLIRKKKESFIRSKQGQFFQVERGIFRGTWKSGVVPPNWALSLQFQLQYNLMEYIYCINFSNLVTFTATADTSSSTSTMLEIHMEMQPTDWRMWEKYTIIWIHVSLFSSCSVHFYLVFDVYYHSGSIYIQHYLNYIWLQCRCPYLCYW